MNINFRLRKSATDLQTVQLQVSLRNKKKKYHTGIRVNPEHWDRGSQRILKKYAYAIHVNKKLQELQDMVMALNFPLTTWADVDKLFAKEEVAPEIKPPAQQTFLEWMSSAIEVESEFLNKRYSDHERVTLKHLQSFNKEFRIGWDNINDLFYKSFLLYLAHVPIKEGAEFPMLNNSIGTYIKFLIKYCEKAHEQGLLKTGHFKKFKILKERVKKISPDEADVLKIYSANYTVKGVRQAVDIYVFRFYAGGLRHGEMKYIKKENVIDIKVENKLYKGIYYVQEKTEEANSIILHPICLKILERYNYQLPINTSQNNNRLVKMAFKLCGFDKDIIIIRHSLGNRIERIVKQWEIYGKSHTARYAAIRMIGEKTGNLVVAQGMAGQKDMRTTQSYFELTDDYKNSEFLKKVIGEK